MVTPTQSPAVAEVFYPESDGQPVAETDVHRTLMFELIAMLHEHFRDDPQVYISGNLFIYYQEGDPQRSVAPDVFVVKGVTRRDRRTYKLWEEGRPPDVVFELTSPSTRSEDRRTKHDLYARLGVAEYFLFDPLDEYLRPPFQGYRLRLGHYRPMRPAADGSLWSAVLGLELHVQEMRLRLFDPVGQRWLPLPEEEPAARRAAEARATVAEARATVAEARVAAESEARQAAEAELAQLRAQLDKRSRP